MPYVAAKDSQAALWEAFQQILAKRQTIKSTIATTEEAAKKAPSQ
ncbi:hypothetical protein [Oculatella sp. LEGE 06141]|nr:hypothetical protein [Oculatella sp. LEGE 06141]